MSYRNRPVLDRKHRPRWQDELRTQQLIVAGFALAIALAIGIFAATAWSAHYEAHLRPVAAVRGVTYDIDDVVARMDIIGSELQGRFLDLQGQMGGVRDPLLQQGQQAIQDEIGRLIGTATDSLVLGSTLDRVAGRYGISVSEQEIDAEVAKRQTLVERQRLSLISIRALPGGADAGAEPTDADWARAEDEINGIIDDLRGGADFADTAIARSADSSAAGGGLLGWSEADDSVYATFFEEAHDAEVGDLLGPFKDDRGYHILRLEDRKAEGPDTALKELLSKAGVSDASYRAYIHGELMLGAFHDYFDSDVMTSYQPQRKVAQIFVGALQGVPTPQQRIRHFLAMPIPGEQDQSSATDEQWAAALARAEAFRAEAARPDADWFELAKESDDTSSGSRGGDLGWYDPASSSFVQPFKDAIRTLGEGELSEPVKTDFGYHIIQVTGSRTSPEGQVGDLVAALREDPDQFAQLAREQSEDVATSAKGGELGWVIRYQLEEARSGPIFALTTPGEISDPVTTANGTYIFKLLDTSPARFVPASQLDRVGQTGFSRWLDEIRAGAGIWVDPQFTSATAAG